jgi:hypothetical protein
MRSTNRRGSPAGRWQRFRVIVGRSGRRGTAMERSATTIDQEPRTRSLREKRYATTASIGDHARKIRSLVTPEVAGSCVSRPPDCALVVMATLDFSLAPPQAKWDLHVPFEAPGLGSCRAPSGDRSWGQVAWSAGGLRVLREGVRPVAKSRASSENPQTSAVPPSSLRNGKPQW